MTSDAKQFVKIADVEAFHRDGAVCLRKLFGPQENERSRWSGNASLQQEFPIFGAATGFVGAQLSIVGARLGEFQGCADQLPAPCSPLYPRDYYPTYAQTNLRAGAKYGPWSASLFANNITDRRGVIGGGDADAFPANTLTIIRPRTVGLNVLRTF